MSKNPTVASKLAAVTSGIPWSIAAGIRCVPMRPLVEAPQMKKLPARSQKLPEPAPSRSPCKLVAMGLEVVVGGGAISMEP
jgi:hypothetical protein